MNHKKKEANVSIISLLWKS